MQSKQINQPRKRDLIFGYIIIALVILTGGAFFSNKFTDAYYENENFEVKGIEVQANSTTTATPTSTPTTTPSSTPTATPTLSPTPTEEEEVNTTKDITYEKNKDRFIVNGISYSFNEIPEIKQGEKITIAGTTESFIDVELIIRSKPKTFSTSSDLKGNWEISLYTDTLEIGGHTFQVTLTDPVFEDREIQLSVVPFTIIEGVETLPASGNTPLEDFIEKYQYLIGAGILTVLVLIISFLLMRRNFGKTKITKPPVGNEPQPSLIENPFGYKKT